MSLVFTILRDGNPYGPKPYWNNNRGPERDPNRRWPEYLENSKRKNVNWCDENEEEPPNTSYPDDQPNNIKFINDLSSDDGFGRILLEEETWEQEEEPWEHEEKLVDESDPSCCALDIPETKEQPQVRIYKRRVDPQPSFLDKHKAINEDNKKEEDLALGDLDLNIDIEKELSKIKQDNV